MIYLDNNATTSVDPGVFEAMRPYFCECYANPSAVHSFGVGVRGKVEEMRKLIAERLNCEPDEIVFTSSGSEANSLCLKGYAFANHQRGNHIITSQIEHASILNTCAFLEKEGFRVTYLPVDKAGFVSAEALQKALTRDTLLISIGHANNEIGTIQPLKELLQASAGIAFHSDAIQSFLKVDFDTRELPLSLASFSGHKFHAPKGCGFIFKRKGVSLTAQIQGGGQEGNLRAGTENVPSIIGLGKAIENFDERHIASMKELQKYLLVNLSCIPGVRINGPENLAQRLCSNVNFSYEALEGETILHFLSAHGICVSTGSACHARQSTISHVLSAIKCPARFIHGNVRVGLSKYTSKSEIDFFLSTLRVILLSKVPCRLQPMRHEALFS